MPRSAYTLHLSLHLILRAINKRLTILQPSQNQDHGALPKRSKPPIPLAFALGFAVLNWSSSFGFNRLLSDLEAVPVSQRSVWPWNKATSLGVHPIMFSMQNLAPASCKTSIMYASPRFAAQWRAVQPSRSVIFTSSPLFRSQATAWSPK